jgi:dihydroorotase
MQSAERKLPGLPTLPLKYRSSTLRSPMKRVSATIPTPRCTHHCALSKHVEAIIEAIKDGTIDALTTDHAPHIEPEKLLPFVDAAMGSTGLETSFAVMYTYLVKPGHITLSEGLALMTHKPAEIIRMKKGSLEVGADADITLFDLSEDWIVDPKHMESKGKNCVFKNLTLSGRAKHVVVGGVLKMQDGEILH